MLGLSNGIGYTGEDISDIIPPSSYSMRFDGAGDFLAITETSFPIELTGEDLSISFWCKRDSDDGDASCILGLSGTASYSRLHFNTDGDALDIESDQNGESANADVTADTNWHHYVVTCRGLGTGSGGASVVTIYEDGAPASGMCMTHLVTAPTAGCNFGNSVDKDITFDRIGSDSGGGTTELKGILYQLAIFDIVLTPDVVKTMYNIGTPISIDNMSGILHHWKFSENTGSTTADSVGSLTATLNGDASFTSTTP